MPPQCVRSSSKLSKHEDVVLRLPEPESAAFWCPPSPDVPKSQPVLDAAFVDDEALVILGKTPRALDLAIDALLNTVFTVFDCLHLQLNANPGKTVALLQYRGKSAKQRREARRCPDGKLRLQVPGRDIQINVVSEYKHLGTFTTLVAGSMRNVKCRVSSTLQAYAPLAWKIDGSSRVAQVHKLVFARALLLSKLLCGVHVLMLTPRQLKHINYAYICHSAPYFWRASVQSYRAHRSRGS